MKINETLKKYREHSGLTQEEIASKCFIQRHTYTQYETGKRNISADMFFTIIEHFGVNISFKERKKLEWALHYTNNEDSEVKDTVFLLIYEDDDMFDLEVYEWDEENSAKGELIIVNTSVLPRGGRLDKVSLDFIIQNEIKENYQIKEVEYQNFDDVDLQLPTPLEKGKKCVYSFSRSQIERLFQRMLMDKFDFRPSINVSFDDETIKPINIAFLDEKTRKCFDDIMKEYDPEGFEKTVRDADLHLKETPIGQFGLEHELYTLNNIFGYETSKLDIETDEEFYKRITPIHRELLINRWYEVRCEDFHFNLGEMLLEKLLNKKITKYIVDDVYEDLIYIHTKMN